MTSTNKSIRAGSAAAQGFADNALNAGEHALDTGRQYAHDAMDRAGETVRDLRAGARDFASRSIHSVADTAAAAQRRLGEYAGATTRYVADQPVKSALIAAAIGAFVAGAIIAARRYNNRKPY